jgi:hypothetical protein
MSQQHHEVVEDSETPFSTFTPFPRLPVELRLQIWSHAIPNGTYIHFSRHSKCGSNERFHAIARCDYPDGIPSLLQVSEESRSIAIKHFHLLGTGRSRIYFNPSVDTILFGLLFRTDFRTLVENPHSILGSNFSLIRHIAVYDQPTYCYWFQRAFLRNFVASLDSFTLLDLRAWEDATRQRKTEQNPRGNINYSALRAIVKPGAFRPDRLVRMSEEELTVNMRLRAFVGQPQFYWLKASERKLNAKVMTYPYTGDESAQMIVSKYCSDDGAVLKVDKELEMKISVSGERQRERMIRDWRHLGMVISKLFPEKMRFFRGTKKNGK